MKNWRLWLEFLGGALGVVLIFSYLSAREDNIRMQSTITAQNQLVKASDKKFSDAQKQITSLESQIQAVRADNAKKIAAVQAQFAKAQTPQQLADLTTQVMGLKQAISIITPAATKENPNPQPVAVVPLADAPQAKQYLQECETCKTNLSGTLTILKAVEAQSAQRSVQISADKEKIVALTKELDAAVKSTKGGNWVRRAVHNSKVLAIGGAIGVAVVCGLGHCK